MFLNTGFIVFQLLFWNISYGSHTSNLSSVFLPLIRTGEYHVLQLIFVLSWVALGLSVWILISEKAIQKIPRCLRKTRQHTVALFCFASGKVYIYSKISWYLHCQVKCGTRCGSFARTVSCLLWPTSWMSFSDFGSLLWCHNACRGCATYVLQNWCIAVLF